MSQYIKTCRTLESFFVKRLINLHTFMHAVNIYRPILQSVLSTALLLKMLFMWQAFAGFVATSELSQACFLWFSNNSPHSSQTWVTSHFKYEITFVIFDMSNSVLFENSAHVHSMLCSLMFVSELHEMFLLWVLFFGPSATL